MLRLPAALLDELRLIGSAVGSGGRLIAHLKVAAGVPACRTTGTEAGGYLKNLLAAIGRASDPKQTLLRIHKTL